jgi:hypothetical protein
VKPDNKLSSLLNMAWELWKPTVGAQEMQTATFLVGTESEEQFSQKSPVHKQILQLFGVWMETTDNVMHSIIPSGVSVLELHHFVNNRAESPVCDSDDHNTTDEEDQAEPDEDHIKEMAEQILLHKALHLTDRKCGRPRKRTEEEEEEEEESEDESGDGSGNED